MNMNNCVVAVYGATGHTGTFVVTELLRRGLEVVAVGRHVSRVLPEVTARVARIDDPAALDRAFDGCSMVINCAGPFLDTAGPVLEAALRGSRAYLDVTAEQASAHSTFDLFDAPARAKGVAIIPAAGFYGGLADLLASALVGSRPVDHMIVAVALDHWWPTKGTRKTGERNRVPRVIIENGHLVPMATSATNTSWTFDPPHGMQEMQEVPLSEIITISRHLQVRNLHSYLNAASLGELVDATTPVPVAVDTRGRSAQRFVMEVVARNGADACRAVARGQDIYAVTAPLVVEAAVRMLHPSFARYGALSLGQAFDAEDFLSSLQAEDLLFDLDPICCA